MFQIQCKLFVFDKASQSWVERGRGLLRLNDMASTDDGTLQSRLGELQCGLCGGFQDGTELPRPRRAGSPHRSPLWRVPAPTACRARLHPKAFAATLSVTLLFVSVMKVDETT